MYDAQPFKKAAATNILGPNVLFGGEYGIQISEAPDLSCTVDGCNVIRPGALTNCHAKARKNSLDGYGIAQANRDIGVEEIGRAQAPTIAVVCLIQFRFLCHSHR